jgi:IPT/TIG domain-containing protein
VVNTGDAVSSLSALVASGRRVNALNALRRPAITSMTPVTAVGGSAGFTLTVDGVNFESNAIVRWNGTNLTTTFVSATRLTAMVTATQVVSPGNVSVTVNNPNAPTLTSSAQTFSISARTFSGGGCFIATAAYGTPMAEDVRYLRAFRDQYLLTSGLGRKFVEVYYRHSPPLADRLRAQDGWRSVVRAALAPLVALSKWIVDVDVLDRQTSDRP